MATLANVADSVTLHEAETELSRLVERVLLGEEVFIARAGVPVVRLVPVPAARRRLGQWAGRVHLSEDFDAPMDPADVDAWEGRS